MKNMKEKPSLEGWCETNLFLCSNCTYFSANAVFVINSACRSICNDSVRVDW